MVFARVNIWIPADVEPDATIDGSGCKRPSAVVPIHDARKRQGAAMKAV
jgi:hypothetical protein